MIEPVEETVEETLEETPEVEAVATPEDGEAEASEESKSLDGKEVEPKGMTQEQIEKLDSKYDNAMTDVKVDGKLIPVTIKDLKSMYSREKYGEQRMIQAANEKKMLQQAWLQAKSNPEAHLKHLGVDPEALAIAILESRIADEQKSPAQRELDELKAKYAELENQKQQQIRAEQSAKLGANINSALEEVGLRQESYLVKRVAHIMHESALRQRREGGEVLSAKEAADIVKGEEVEPFKRLADLPTQKVRELLGDKIIQQLLKDEVERVQQGAPGSIKSSGSSEAPKAPARKSDYKKPRNEREWREYVDSL